MPPLRLRSFALSVISLLLAACQPYQAPVMTPQEAQRIADLTARMSTRCIGRYLIDRPEVFVLNDQSRTEIEGVKITAESLKKPEFDNLLQARTEVLNAETIYGEQTKSLTAVHELPDKLGRVFNRSRSRESEVLRTLELRAFKHGMALTMTVDAREMRPGLPQPGDTRQTDTPQKLAQLLKVYERTRGRQDDEIPTEQGVCFANGFVKGASTGQEWIDMHHHWKEVKDVYFSYHFMSDIGPLETSLLGRGGKIEANLGTVNGKTVRKGKRDSHGLQYEEWLLYRDGEPEGRLYDYMAELNGTFGNAEKPLLRLEFASGVHHPRRSLTLEEAAVDQLITQASLGEAQSTALWDKVTSTLRPRPGAF